ncbi:hypothetical protein IL306_012332, partial [Fusarium sp. DS 682]
MFSAFNTSRSSEVNALIKKHGITDALFIKNLGYFSNISLTEIRSSGYTTMHTGVRLIVHALKDPIGLTPTEVLILSFWASHLGVAKIPFLGEHALTIFAARGAKGPYSEGDLEFMNIAADCIKDEVKTTEKTRSQACTEYGDILDVAYALTMNGGKELLLSGADKPPREAPGAEEIQSAPPDKPEDIIMGKQDIDKLTDPKEIHTLAGVELAISRIEKFDVSLNTE